MSTSAVSTSSLNQSLQQYFQTRHTDLKQLSDALNAGDLSAAQTAFNNISSLGQNGPFTNGQPFAIAQREQDFQAVGQALQNGDLSQAQAAFGALGGTFAPHGVLDPIATAPGAGTGSGAGAGPEIVLNLSGGNTGAPEQVTINISNSSSGGGEQVSLSVGNQSSNPQEITFNLGANSNEQIVLNLLGASSSTSGASSTSGSGTGISVSA